ncbi:MAG: dihydroorotase family protein [Candidatus Hodarchaeota archaeon]
MQLCNARLFINSTLTDGCLSINEESGKISKISKIVSSSEPQIDCKGLILLPGIIDLHTHLRDFEESHKETFLTGTQAAAHGGITTVLDMPNKKPLVETIEQLREVQKRIADQAIVDVIPYLMVSEDVPLNKQWHLYKAFYGGTTGVDGISLRRLREALNYPECFISVHAEDPEVLFKHSRLNYDPIHDHCKLRAPEAEDRAVKQILENVMLHKKSHLHFAHISTAQALKQITEAKKASKQISCEVTPHHLFLNTDDYSTLTIWGKMNPPLRNPANNSALFAGLKDKTIDVIATDHAPHTYDEKTSTAPSGVPGLETALPLLLDRVNRNQISLARVVDTFSTTPAQLVGLNSVGRIKEGYDADLVLIDLKRTWTIKSNDLYTKCGWSPFENQTVKGIPVLTLTKGKVVFEGNI